MRKRIRNIFIIMMLMACSMLFISCDAIMAQNIPHNGSGSGMNGSGRGMNGGQGQGRNGGPNFMPGMANADITGKIIYVGENSIKIQLAENTQNNDNNQGGTLGFNFTGTEKTITVDDNVNISQADSRQNKKIKLSDLKSDQVIIIWYKPKNQTAERISIVQ